VVFRFTQTWAAELCAPPVVYLTLLSQSVKGITRAARCTPLWRSSGARTGTAWEPASGSLLQAPAGLFISQRSVSTPPDKYTSACGVARAVSGLQRAVSG
jgi:hypothetical protein